MPSVLRLLSLGALAATALGSRISFFSDADCQDFESELDGPNGYMDGQCSSLTSKGNFTSFKVVGLDRGCAVTVYGPDTTVGPCNPEGLLTTDLGNCYSHPFWTYYSIDGCMGNPPESSSASSTSSIAPPTSSTVVSSASTSASAQTTSAENNAPGTSSTSSTAGQPTLEESNASDNGSDTASSSSGVSTGTVAGGVVGGIAGLALIIGGVWFLLRRRRRQPPAGATEFSELSGEPKAEIHGKEVPEPSELSEGHKSWARWPQEMSAERWSGIGGRVEKPPLYESYPAGTHPADRSV